MSKVVKKEYVLEGLDCANCALKIEKGVSELEGVEHCSLNFVNKTLVFEATENQAVKIEADAKAIVHKLEPDVVVMEKGQQTTETTSWFTFKQMQLGIGAALFGLSFFLPEKWELFGFLFAYLVIGAEIVWKAIRNSVRGQLFDENFLMTIATVGAFCIGAYGEAVAVMVFYQIGEAFQSYAVNRSRKSIATLMDIRPDVAHVQTIHGLVTKKVEEVSIGDRIVVKPGERIGLDGIVVEGTSSLDTSALTGESIPRDVKLQDDVLSGCLNVNGLLVIEVTKIASQSTVSKILDLVEHASSKKAPTENFITTFARYYTPAVVLIATLLAVIPPLVTGAPFSEWVYRALVFLVISCPCALVVSIPLGFFGGIGSASRHGILVKGGNYLEALNNVETVVFDKTGTLTKGTFTVQDIIVANGTKEEILHHAAVAEANSNHPIALSILKAYGGFIDTKVITSLQEIPGRGIRVETKEKHITIGNYALMKEEGIEVQMVDAIGTIVYVAVDGVYQGAIIIADEIKEDSKRAIQELKALGVQKIVMLTGDHHKVAQVVGEELQVDEIYSDLLPHQKVEAFERIPQGKGKKIFVGDGINDTPVLAQADIGIAMGGLGSQAAMDVADIVIMNDEPSKIATGIRIAKRTKTIVWQNIFLAFGVKLLVLFLGTFGMATMWEAVFADVGVTLLAVFNAMRVLKGEGRVATLEGKAGSLRSGEKRGAADA